jgi:plastocyanin
MLLRLFVAGLLMTAVAACQGPGSARTQQGAQVNTGSSTTGGSGATNANATGGTPAAGVGTGGAQAGAAANGQKAPGPYNPNGEVDGSSGKASIQMLDAMKYQPNGITKVKPGAQVTVTLQNTGAVVHDFLSPALGVTKAVAVNGGQTGTVTFTAPSQPGTYQFWCDQPGHAAAGMVGQVTVG